MRILFLADAVQEDKSGGSRLVARELARGLVGRGHAVTFLVARFRDNTPAAEVDHGVRIVRYPGARTRHYLAQGRAAGARLWREGSFDIVHTHFAYAALGPSAALPATVPRLRTFYGSWPWEKWLEDAPGAPPSARYLVAAAKKWVRDQIENRDLRRSQRVIVLSDYSAAQVAATHRVAAPRVVQAPGGVDVARFAPASDRRQVRAQLGLPPDWTILLSVRRLTPRMGLDLLIQAMPAVLRRRPHTLLLIGGQGPEREKLQILIAKAGLEQHVQLLGFIPDAQLVAHYQAADLFVLPTVDLEGFGLVTVEALACGTPVLGSAAGATPEILRQLDERLIVEEISAQGLAVAITNFWQADVAGALPPARLHQFVRDRYTWDRHVDVVEAAYRQVIKEGQRR